MGTISILAVTTVRTKRAGLTLAHEGDNLEHTP